MNTKQTETTAADAPEAPQTKPFGTCASCETEFQTVEAFNAHLADHNAAVLKSDKPTEEHSPSGIGEQLHKANLKKANYKAHAQRLAGVLMEIKFSLNACQLVISDATARETVRDLVAQANKALADWERSNQNE